MVTEDLDVFEWGAGGSTLFFARRAASVVTIEHDPAWLALVRERIEAIAATWVGHLVVPTACEGGGDPSDPDAFTSRHQEHREQSFRAYVEAVDEHADESLDLVMVDGRARPSCVVAGAPKVRPGGLLVLDDSHRPTYQRVQASPVLDGWERHDFFGPAPRSRRFVCTTAWRRPAHG